MKKLTFGEVQKIEFDILCKFSAFCEENNLTYMLCGGTLLGAVRHGGFIPWDDDVDLLMPRPDYDRLINGKNINYSILGNDIEICHWKNGELPIPFIKIVDKRTIVKSKYVRENMDIGRIWIDVFPLDGNPDNIQKAKGLYRKTKFLHKLLILRMEKIGKGKTHFRTIIKAFVITVLKLVSVEWMCENIDRKSKKYDYGESNYAGGVLWGYGICERMKKEKYEKLVKLKFEDRFFNAPMAYDEYLSNLYGNYWKLPEETDRKEEHILQAYMQ